MKEENKNKFINTHFYWGEYVRTPPVTIYAISLLELS
jgi:hypothetical protein